MPVNTIYKGPDALPDVIPIFPLAGALLLPRGQMPLNIFEPRYLAMIDDAFSPIRCVQARTRANRICSVSAASGG
jgi:Lon protease-like protein